ncbi:MAG TPA: MBL fold metallo-hydrolase [Pyrinomonadaceae bacterium]|jgi:DNA-binding beta-propeller fold protein YncE|nr:MBL fold metallo-hydrolase [Pyrinomonadaceae bacterium]
MKMVRVVGLCALQLLIFVSAHFAQGPSGPAWDSNRRAARVLEAGINALGGMENVRRADKVAVNYKGVNHPLGQNAAFDAPPADFQRVGAKTLIDYAGGRYVTEGQSNSAGGYQFNFRYVVAPRRSFSLDVLRNRRGAEVRNMDERTKSQFKVGMLTEVPHLLLLYASQRPETLRWVGEAEERGRKFRVVSFAAEHGVEMSLYFDAQTNLLARTEQLDAHPLLGDVRYAQDFSDYRTVGGVKIPGRRLAFANQLMTAENEYAEVRLDFAEGERLLEVPAGFVEPAPPRAAPEVMRKLGDGVYLIERVGQAYRVMFVEFDDYVMVLEAPTDANASKAVIKLVRQTAPGKPIRYVSFSHFHFDHTGGLREYVAEGATVVVPPGNRSFVEQIARSKHTLKPDALAASPRPPLVETFEKKRVFADGKRTVELHSIGPTSHVRDMVMFYFPKEKVLFQGDMFSPLDAGGIPPVIEINHELVKKVGELKLDVKTLVAVHSGAVAWEDFRRAEASAARPGAAGVLAVAYMNEARLALVEGETFQTLATLETGKNPHEVRVSPDGRDAYVAAGKFVSAVDLRGRRLRATFDLGTYSAHDIRVSRDGRRLWAACAGAQTVLELDSETGRTLKAFKTEQQGSWFVEVTPDEKKLYTPNLEGKSVSVIDRATGRVKVIGFDYPVYGIDITPDGKQVWVSGRDLAVIDTATDEVVATVNTSEAEAGRLRLTSDGKKVVVALSKKLAVFDAQTRRLLSETELSASPKVLTLSGDDRRAFLTNPDDDSVSVVDIVEGKLLSTFKTGRKPDGIGWAN